MMIRNLIWTISLFNLIHSSTSFVVTTLQYSDKFCQYSDTFRLKSNPSKLPRTISTTISASASVLSSSSIPKDDVNCERLETLLDETLESNSTAASSLLNLINDAGDGSVVDQLLQLVDNLPAWTKVRILGKFSRRARRASLRRDLNVPNGSEVTVSVRRKAFVSALQSIAGAAYNDDIKTIEQDTRRESKTATPGSDDTNSEVEANQSSILEATVEQKAKAKTAALEQDAKDRKALNAELERKQRRILEATLQTKTSTEDIERDQALTTESESNERSLRGVFSRPKMILSLDKDVIVTPATKDNVDARSTGIANARRQPKSEEERKALEEKYGSMELGLRAYTILDDLGMLENA